MKTLDMQLSAKKQRHMLEQQEKYDVLEEETQKVRMLDYET